jgi:hypothetical protein
VGAGKEATLAPFEFVAQELMQLAIQVHGEGATFLVGGRVGWRLGEAWNGMGGAQCRGVGAKHTTSGKEAICFES